jgi:uncharacterized membrane protein
MNMWIIYGLLAGASYGLSAIPMKFAASRSDMPVSPQLLLLASCLGSVIVSLGTGIATGRSVGGSGSMNVSTVFPALLAGVIGSLGCFMVIKALGSPNASTANVMALVSTSVVFSLVFGMAFLGEVPAGPQLAKTVGGILLMTAGAVVLSL